MGFLFRYGNPYGVPGVGGAIMNAAEQATSFARRIESERMYLAARQQDMAEAKLALEVDQRDVENEYRERYFAFQQSQAKQEQDWRQTQSDQAHKWRYDRAQVSDQQWMASNERANQSMKIQEEQMDFNRQARKDAADQRSRDEWNTLQAANAEMAVPGGAPPAGKVNYKASDGVTYWVDSEAKQKMDQLNLAHDQAMKTFADKQAILTQKDLQKAKSQQLETYRQEMNKLSSMGAALLGGKRRANTYVYTDLRGRQWEIPAKGMDFNEKKSLYQMYLQNFQVEKMAWAFDVRSANASGQKPPAPPRPLSFQEWESQQFPTQGATETGQSGTGAMLPDNLKDKAARYANRARKITSG